MPNGSTCAPFAGPFRPTLTASSLGQTPVAFDVVPHALRVVVGQPGPRRRRPAWGVLPGSGAGHDAQPARNAGGRWPESARLWPSLRRAADAPRAPTAPGAGPPLPTPGGASCPPPPRRPGPGHRPSPAALPQPVPLLLGQRQLRPGPGAVQRRLPSGPPATPSTWARRGPCCPPAGRGQRQLRRPGASWPAGWPSSASPCARKARGARRGPPWRPSSGHQLRLLEPRRGGLPLRLLALFSSLVGWLTLVAREGGRGSAAVVVLTGGVIGVGAGFAANCCPFLLPLWLWGWVPERERRGGGAPEGRAVGPAGGGLLLLWRCWPGTSRWCAERGLGGVLVT